jgi:osmotically-inducible protein OsmY
MRALFPSFRHAVLAGLLVTGAIPVPLCVAQAADNSVQNKGRSVTAEDAGTSKSDRLTTAQIRKVLMADKDLSVYAHNVKIVVQDGNVTLKGVVKSEEERQQVLGDAHSIAPAEKIGDELTIAH